MDNVICAIVLDLLSALINERYCAENVILATFNYTEIEEREDMSREGFKVNGACTGMSACGPLLYESGHVAHDAHTGGAHRGTGSLASRDDWWNPSASKPQSTLVVKKNVVMLQWRDTEGSLTHTEQKQNVQHCMVYCKTLSFSVKGPESCMPVPGSFAVLPLGEKLRSRGGG